MHMNIATHRFISKRIGMMDYKATEMLMLLCFVILSYQGINGEILSREEDAELDRQLKILNKPAVKTIQTIYGDTYNCVDFYQQPAFDHPLLKDHKFQFQMRRKEKDYNQRSSKIFFKPKKIWLNKKGCPFGTVPIKNVTKDDLIRAKLATKIYSSKLDPQNANDRPGVKYSVLRTKDNPHTKYYGGFMGASLYNQQVQNNEYSSIQMKLENGLDTIVVGSTVNPIVYKDHKTRLFIYTTTDNAQCFNNLCSQPMFVLGSTEIPLDMAFTQTSMRGNGSQIVGYRYFIYKDAANGNYYLQLDRDSTEVGWWPQRVFTSLADSASKVEWGGEVYSPPDIPSPPMGSGGADLWRSTKYDAFCAKIKVVNEAHKMIDPPETDVYVDTPYHGLDLGNIGGQYQYLFIFGGNGTPK